MRSVLRRWGVARSHLPRSTTVPLGLVAIVAVGAVLRIAWAVTRWRTKGLHDPGLYMVLADQVANGHGYSYPGVDGGVTAYYPPGYGCYWPP